METTKSGKTGMLRESKDNRTVREANEVLEGKSRKGFFLRLLPFLGPAFIASIAYMDPGNFATNISGGAQFGYTLLWVIVASNLMAMLIQSLSAKLGIATGKNLAEHCAQDSQGQRRPASSRTREKGEGMSIPIPLENQNLPSTCFVFKHSTTCPVSARAEAEVKEMRTEIPVYLIKVREQRALSNWIAATYGVTHESPQLILIRDGKAEEVWNHGEIRREDIRE